MERLNRFVIGSCALVAMGSVGCAADATVLSSETRLSEGDGEVPQGTDAAHVWESCAPEDGVFDTGETGDACEFENICGRQEGCDMTYASCEQGRLNVVTIYTDQNRYGGLSADCNANIAVETSGNEAVWDDCPTALAHGKADDFCTGQFNCARPAEDPCCIEVAACTGHPYPLRFTRTTVCQQGCQHVEPDPQQAVVTDCASVREAVDGRLTSRVDRPCSGDFICGTRHHYDLSGDGPMNPEEIASGPYYTAFFWCRDGLLMGNINN